MKRVSFDDITDNQKVIENINLVEKQIKSVKKQVQKNEYTNGFLQSLLNNIYGVLNYWVGYTYVGVQKDIKLKESFQGFFESFYELLLLFKESNNKELRKYANKVLYQGEVHRYLGYPCSQYDDSLPYIEPKYDNYFASWSKFERIEYIEGKLGAKKTILHANISGKEYGIDLLELGVGRENEAEVVFPMYKYSVYSVTKTNM